VLAAFTAHIAVNAETPVEFGGRAALTGGPGRFSMPQLTFTSAQGNA